MYCYLYILGGLDAFDLSIFFCLLDVYLYIITTRILTLSVIAPANRSLAMCTEVRPNLFLSQKRMTSWFASAGVTIAE